MWPILKWPSAFSKMRQTAVVNIILKATAHLTGKWTDDLSYNRAVFSYLNLHSFFSKLFAWVDTWKCEKYWSHYTESDTLGFLQKFYIASLSTLLSLCVKEVLSCVRFSSCTQMLSLFIMNEMNEKYKQPQQSGRENLMLVLSIPNFTLIFVVKYGGFVSRCERGSYCNRWCALCLTSWLG